MYTDSFTKARARQTNRNNCSQGNLERLIFRPMHRRRKPKRYWGLYNLQKIFVSRPPWPCTLGAAAAALIALCCICSVRGQSARLNRIRNEWGSIEYALPNYVKDVTFLSPLSSIGLCDQSASSIGIDGFIGLLKGFSLNDTAKRATKCRPTPPASSEWRDACTWLPPLRPHSGFRLHSCLLDLLISTSGNEAVVFRRHKQFKTLVYEAIGLCGTDLLRRIRRGF